VCLRVIVAVDSGLDDVVGLSLTGGEAYVGPWSCTEWLPFAREMVLCSGSSICAISSAERERRFFGAEREARRPLRRKP
jgi:hypothetical protein